MRLRSTRLTAIAHTGSAIASFSPSSLSINFVSISGASPFLDSRITFARASTGTYVNSSGVLSSAAIDTPRFDYDPVTLEPKGLLIEEQRTNSLRNNTMVGAVVGTPGTAPTNWLTVAGGGLSREITAIGTEAGISYLDIRFFGTGSSVAAQRVYAESTATVAAANGQAWSLSAYVKLVAGTAPSGLFIGFDETGPGATYIRTDSASLPLTSTLTRNTYSATLSGGVNVAFILPQIGFNSAIGVAVDFTIRIGMPQLEQGAFATSVIPTSTTALTRAADVARVTGADFSSWFNSEQGTMFVEAQQPVIFAASKTAASFADGTNSQRFNLYRRSTGSINAFSNPGNVVLSSGLVATASVPWKSALAYSASPASFSANGITPLSLFYTVNPNVLTELVIGNAFTGGNEYFNGHIRSLKYYQTRLSDAELQALTS